MLTHQVFPHQVSTSETIHTTVTTVWQATYMTQMRSEKEILNFFEEEQISVHCDPRCGDCQCGTCALGTKQMSIHDEKEYKRFKSLTYLDKKGTPNNPSLYWVAMFPWNIDPTELPDNKAAVTDVTHVTKKKLQKKPGVERDLQVTNGWQDLLH